MPVTLRSLEFAIICDGKELQTHGVKQEHNSKEAFVASEAGKQFKITYNNLSGDNLLVHLYIDGKFVVNTYLLAVHQGQVFGIRTSTTLVLPFKFQELQLVDPDLESAPVVPEMGIIEVRAFRAWDTGKGTEKCSYHVPALHQGQVSERSKQAGWHHVGTAEGMNIKVSTHKTIIDYLDPLDAPYMSFKIFYRPKELLMAQGVITGHSAGAVSEANDRKRAREDNSPGPSTKRRTGSTVKKEEMSANARAQRIQALQAELNSLTAEQFGSSSVKHELRSPSPIVVGKASGEVVDLTLDD